MTARSTLAVSLAIGVSAALSTALLAQGRGQGTPTSPFGGRVHRQPWTVRFQARLTGLPGDELMEYICQEHNQYGIAQGINR